MRYVNLIELKKLFKQRAEENFKYTTKIMSYNQRHCKICGDTNPKYGFMTMLDSAIFPIPPEETSQLICANCGLSDEQYEKEFKEPKEKLVLNKFFDAIFCLNLERRPDRKLQAEAEFKKHNINVEFVTGIDGKLLPDPEAISKDQLPVSPGDIGCTLSHLKIVQLAKERGLKQILILEDDVEFAENFNTVFPDYFSQVPEDWDFLYFGGNHSSGGLQLLSNDSNVARIFYTYTTHAYAIRESVFDAMIEVLQQKEKVDINIGSLHSKFNSYCFRPHLAFQRESFSDILDKPTNYVHLRE